MARIALLSLYDEFCLGLRYLAGYLERAGHEVEMGHFRVYGGHDRDPRRQGELEGTDFGEMVQVLTTGDLRLALSTPFTRREVDLLIEELARRKPAAVGISVPSYNVQMARTLTAAIRERLGLPVVWGGIHPTADPEDAIAGKEEAPDAICLSEGEVSFDAFLKALDAGADLAEAPLDGMWVRRADGVVKHNPKRPVVHDLDDLAWQYLEMDKEFVVEGDRVFRLSEHAESHLVWSYKILASRGCPCRCSFCVNSILKRDYPDMKRVRHRSPGDVIGELRRAKEKLPYLRFVEFYDEVFYADAAWLDEFAELYRREIALPFWCYTFPNVVTAESLERLKAMGVQHVIMGIQSGSDRVNYEVFDRRTSRERILRAARLIGEAGIMGYYDVITNNPYETEEDRFATLDLIAQLPERSEIQLSQLAWLPATQLTLRAREEGMLDRADPKVYKFWNALYLLADNRIGDRETLLALARDAHLRENPQFLWDVLASATAAQSERLERERLRRRADDVLAEFETLRCAYDALRGRRVVRWAERAGDAVKRLAGGGA